MRLPLTCFKANDIRGTCPHEINAAFAFALGKACVELFKPGSVIIGYDARLSSPLLASALTSAFSQSGAPVTSLGLCGTEEIYFACANYPYDLGIMVTASHNPANENGFKIIRAGAIPLEDMSALSILTMTILEGGDYQRAGQTDPPGVAADNTCRNSYIEWLLAFTGLDRPRCGNRLKVVVDAGNGSAGPVLLELSQRAPFDFIELNWRPDGSFPNGLPNPLLPERRQACANAVRQCRAVLGVAFDGDFDRCFFFDASGSFIESYYIVGLLAAAILRSNPGQKIIHDQRLYWNTRDIVLKLNGKLIPCPCGHTLIKQKMRAEKALFGGEMSGHFYYRDFAFCDSGMLTMLLLLSLLQSSRQELGTIISERVRAYPCSGEINFQVSNPASLLESVWQAYAPRAIHADRLDGINLEFPQWRFNLRASRTEALTRLNVESRGSVNLCRDKTEELSQFIQRQAHNGE